MGNFENNLNLFTFVFDKNEINKETLINIFNIDEDFSQNKEYFRPDTIEMGYANESERCAEEIYNKYKKINDPVKRFEKMIGNVINHYTGSARFIIGNTSCSGDWSFDVTDVNESIVLSLAYIG